MPSPPRSSRHWRMKRSGSKSSQAILRSSAGSPAKPLRSTAAAKATRWMKSCDRVANHATVQASVRITARRRSPTCAARLSAVPRRPTPCQPSLISKKVDQESNVYSVRIGLGYRALGVMDGSTVVWFWIGSHADCDRLLGWTKSDFQFWISIFEFRIRTHNIM